MEEKVLKYLTTVKRCWLDGSYENERGASILAKKIDVLQLTPSEYESAEKELIMKLSKAVDMLKDLSTGDELSKTDRLEFVEYCSDLGLNDDDADMILESDIILREANTKGSVNCVSNAPAIGCDIQQETDLLFNVNEDLESYKEIRGKYHEIASEISEDFYNCFYNKFKDMDELHNNCEEFAYDCIDSAVEIAVNVLINDDGIHTCDKDTFRDEFVIPVLPWPSLWSSFDEQYQSIVLTTAEIDAYRTSCRQNSGGWVGGGFGIEGAAKGALTAGAANLATGALHGLFNMGAKLASSISDSMKKDSIFKDPSTRVFLRDALYQSVLCVHEAYINAYNHFSEDYIPELSPDDIIKSAKLFKNVVEGRISVNQSKSALIEAISLNPFVDEYYIHWFDTFGDADGKLEATAEYFKTHVIYEIKYDLIDAKSSELDFISDKTYPSSVIELQKFAESIGFRDYNDISEGLIADIKKDQVKQKQENLKTHGGAVDTAARFDELDDRIKKIASSYKTNIGEHFYIIPELDDKKLSNFMKKRGTSLKEGDAFLAFFDETSGGGDIGICLTTKYLICNAVDSFSTQFSQPLNQIVNASVSSGFLKKKVIITTKNGNKLEGVFSQSEDGLKRFVDLLNKCIALNVVAGKEDGDNNSLTEKVNAESTDIKVQPIERHTPTTLEYETSWGTINSVITCPKCQHKGEVRTKMMERKKGISVAKAAGAWATCGLSLFATGISKKEEITQGHCDKCNSTWDL